MKIAPVVGIGLGLSSAANAAENENYTRAAFDAVGAVFDPVDVFLMSYDITTWSLYSDDGQQFLEESVPWAFDPTLRAPDGTRINDEGQMISGPGPKF